MVTVFIKIVGKLSGGEVILAAMVMNGVLKDSMKLNVEGKTVGIERMGTKSIEPGAGPHGASVTQTN